MSLEFGREHSCDWLFAISSVHTAVSAVQGIISLVAHDDPGDHSPGSPSWLLQIAGQFSDCFEGVGRRLLFNVDRSCFELAQTSRRHCRRLVSVMKGLTESLLCYRVQSDCKPSDYCLYCLCKTAQASRCSKSHE